MSDTPFTSVKQALACAGRLTLPLAYPAARDVRVQRSPDQSRADLAIAVRAAMVRVAVDPYGEVAARLFAWSCESDDAADDVDDLDDAELEELRREGMTLASARKRVAAELRRSGLVPERRLRLMPVGYRVADVAGRRHVILVSDPSPNDPTVLRGPDARERAQAIAAGHVDGPVVETIELEPRRVQHASVRDELAPRWRAGEFRTLGALDVAIAERLGCTTRHARRVRASWGIVGIQANATRGLGELGGAPRHASGELDIGSGYCKH